jgi:hypothetical protein
MTDYARLFAKFEVSSSSDYANPYVDPPIWTETFTPDEVLYNGRIEAALDPSTTTITTSIYSSVSLFALRNVDSTNYVTITFHSAGHGATHNIVRVPAGGVFITQDFTASYDVELMANTAALNCEVLILGT